MKHEAGHASFPHRGTAPCVYALLLWIVVEKNPSSFETETHTRAKQTICTLCDMFQYDVGEMWFLFAV